MNLHLLAWWLPAVLLIWPLVAQAQGSNSDGMRGSISGTLLFAANNRSADGVKVDLVPSAGGPVFWAFTDMIGHFEFADLRQGTYDVVVEESGYEPIRERVGLSVGLHPRLLLYLSRANATNPTEPGYSVSARELSIPARARNAFQKGLERLAKRDPVGSLTHFQRAAAAFPSYYEAYFQIGEAELSLGHKEEAEQAFRRSVELSKGRFAEPYRALGQLFCQRGEFSEAEAILRKGLELDTSSSLSHFLLAQALLGMNRLDDAEGNARKVVARESDFPEVHLLLANIYIRRRDYVSLLKELKAYLKLEPNGAMSAQARRTLEVVERKLANSESALAASPKQP